MAVILPIDGALPTSAPIAKGGTTPSLLLGGGANLDLFIQVSADITKIRLIVWGPGNRWWPHDVVYDCLTSYPLARRWAGFVTEDVMSHYAVWLPTAGDAAKVVFCDLSVVRRDHR